MDSHSARNVIRVSYFRSEVEVGNVLTQTVNSKSDTKHFPASTEDLVLD